MTKLEIALKALEEIKTEQGKVCSQYEICTHNSCRSSYNSWAIADKALNDIDKTTDNIIPVADIDSAHNSVLEHLTNKRKEV